jgi:D-3-phosphoglycerate dehydrogenase
MKILIPEKFNKAGIALLEDAGYEVTFKPDTTPEELVEMIPEYDALIVRSATTVTREVIETGTKLKIIGRAGVGVDNIDRDAATERGVIVCNAPLSNVVSAAEQTMALMLACARNTVCATASMKNGKWDRSKFTGIELQDKTLGIFGTGHVGLLVAERAKAFGMKLIGYDPYCPPERAAHYGITLLDNIDDVCKQSNFITLHMPKTPETTGMIGAKQMAEMPEGGIILNVARGGLIDLDALADALENGHLGGAGVDVWEHEPVIDSPIHKFDNVAITPHLGASTKEAQTRAATQIAEYVIAGLEGKTVNTVVNSARIPADVMARVGEFMPVAQKTGEILAQLVGGGIDKVKVVARGKIADADPTVLGTAALAGIVSFGSEIPVNIINAGYIAEQRGLVIETGTDVLSESYPSYLEITAFANGEEYTVCATRALGYDMPRIIEMLGLPVDFVPEKDIVVIEYADKPGQIGKIGTVFGDAGINVESMQIAKAPEHPLVEVLLNLNQPVPANVRRALENAIDAERIWYIDL